MPPATSLKVGWSIINGDSEKPSPWLDFPRRIISRSPFDRDQAVFFRFNKQDVEKAVRVGRRQIALDAWSLVLGQLPPIPNVQKLAPLLQSRPLSSVRDSYACFRGVRRPVGLDDRGFDFVAFVSKPYWFVASAPSLSCLAELRPVPDDLVFVVFMRLDQPSTGRYGVGVDSSTVSGVITHWQLIESVTVDGEQLPVGYRQRFRKRLW